jgi:hypothetical protein
VDDITARQQADPLLLAGRLDRDVDRRQRAPGLTHELLEPELGITEQARTALVQRDAALIERERAFKRQAAGLELGDGLLELGEGLIETELSNPRIDRARCFTLDGRFLGRFPGRFRYEAPRVAR